MGIRKVRTDTKKYKAMTQESIDLMTATLREMGAVDSDFYPLKIDTPAGVLRIAPYGDWIATRFDDPQKSTEILGEQRVGSTGKWNFHVADGQTQEGQGNLRLWFRSELESLLKKV